MTLEGSFSFKASANHCLWGHITMLLSAALLQLPTVEVTPTPRPPPAPLHCNSHPCNCNSHPPKRMWRLN